MTITLTREEAQQVLDALEGYRASTEDFNVAYKCAVLTETLRARLAQPEPEPVAWAVKFNGGFTNNIFTWKLQAEDEMLRLNTKYPDAHRELVPLYTAPPQREWQDLTSSEMVALLAMTSGSIEKRIAEFAVALEAKLKENNK